MASSPARTCAHAYYGNGPLTGAGQSVGVFELGAYDVRDISDLFST